MKHWQHWHWVVIYALIVTAPSSQSFAWSKSDHLNFNIQSESKTIDSIENAWISLNSQAISLDWFQLADWVISQNSKKAASAIFVYRTIPTLELQLIVYPKGSWLSDMKDESIRKYIESLPQQFPDSAIQLTNQNQYEPSVGSVPFLEGTFRKVFYTVTPKTPGTSPFMVNDYWTVTRDGILAIARYSGESTIVTNMSSVFERELAQFLIQER